MKNILPCLALALAACAPGGSGDGGQESVAIPDGPSDGEGTSGSWSTEDFFERGPGAVPQGGELDALHGSVGLMARLFPVPGFPSVYNVILRNTGSGYVERFLLQIPVNAPPGPRPLLVVYHRYGVSHGDALFNTSFPAECDARSWYMVAPLGANQSHFSSVESQINTARALDLVLGYYPIDRTRIYGVGFSMGGGAATNFAARHLDPAGARFAALVNHTGTVSIAHAHANEFDDADQDDGIVPFGSNLEAVDYMEFWNGGSPAAQPFSYRRSSTIDLDPLTGLVGSGTDLARNLAHVPVMTWIASNDPNLYLPAQTFAFANHIQTQNPFNLLVTVNDSVHSWNTLDETQACDWLQSFKLDEPTQGSQLVDGDAQSVHRFVVRQDLTGGFTPFQWKADAVWNRLSLWNSRNLKRLEVDATEAGLAYAGMLRLNLSNFDGTADEVLFRGVPFPPSFVTRDGLPASGSYDPLTQSYLVLEPNGAGHQWVLQF